MSNIIVLGSQWGDEGKGKIVDLFSEKFDIVARYQGGHNAGHTVQVGPQKFVLKLIPSGVLHPHTRVVIGNGVVVDPQALLDELDMLEQAGIDIAGKISLSSRAHVIFPFHRMVEKVSENRVDRVAIGTTSRGIGPCYEDKVGRRGIRMADLLNPDLFRTLYSFLSDDKQTIARAFGINDDIRFDEILADYLRMAERIRPMVCDTARLLNDEMARGKRVLFEGAQGTMLDIDHGTYPFVTSSSAAAGGACTGTGVPPTKIDGVIGVSKAYITRVGGGPFPSEDTGPGGDRIREAGLEYGSVTGRPRRCGWFDVPLLRYTAMVNGFDSLIVTKLDVLDGLGELKVCTSYRVHGEVTDEMPAANLLLEQVEPVYETVAGWDQPTSGITRYQDLPQATRDYVAFLEERTGVEVGAVSTGPERSETIVRPGSKLEKLLG
ncbi:MAG: adenylosuccinate synthase [Bryobacteraceae bacterium]|nr:adenylosuccinate synthase [Solibacteraceae bacterium]MCL4841434.1 adenylosuccinate synthase [Bryobacteraceae bacterium]MCO5351487.1 adenylosuccinate synthase [Bryobacteraceae bacterium]